MSTDIVSAYPLPVAGGKDETHRLNLQHDMITKLLGDIYTAPLPHELHNVADLGCGTGIWSRQFAALYPETKITGIDLNQTTRFPEDPQSIQFATGNLEQGWSFVAQPFDVIWTRFLVTAMKDWPRFFRRASQSLAPGGVFESFEAILQAMSDDASVNIQNSAFLRFSDMALQRLTENGVAFESLSHFGKMVKEAGMELVKEEEMSIYLDEEIAAKKNSKTNPEVVQALREDLESGLISMTEGLFDDQSRPTIVDARILLREALADMHANSKVRGYHMSYISLVARKPQK